MAVAIQDARVKGDTTSLKEIQTSDGLMGRGWQNKESERGGKREPQRRAGPRLACLLRLERKTR